MNYELTNKLNKELEKQIDNIAKEGIQMNNIEMLDMLVDIHKDIANEEYWDRKEKNMYGTYGNYGRDYNRDNYGMRARDSRGRYRGEEHLDRIYNEYGKYMEDKNRYGASGETDASYHYMVKALEDFIQVLYQEADTPQQKQMLNEALQKSMR